MKNVTSSGNAIGNACLPTIGSNNSRSASIKDSITACPLEGRIDGLPTSHSTRRINNVDTVQPVTMLFVIAHPLPKSINFDAAGATPPSSAANAGEIPVRDNARNASFVSRDMRQSRRVKGLESVDQGKRRRLRQPLKAASDEAGTEISRMMDFRATAYVTGTRLATSER